MGLMGHMRLMGNLHISLIGPVGPIRSPAARAVSPIRHPALAYRLPALDAITTAFASYRLMAARGVLRSALPRCYEK